MQRVRLHAERFDFICYLQLIRALRRCAYSDVKEVDFC